VHCPGVSLAGVFERRRESASRRSQHGLVFREVELRYASGGESAGVWLSSLGSDKTAVKVSTAKSFAGMAGQKSWDK